MFERFHLVFRPSEIQKPYYFLKLTKKA